MLALRATLRCNVALRRTMQCINITQFCNKSSVVDVGSLSTNQFKKQPALLTECLTRRRNFATKSNEDLEAKDLQRIYYGSLTPRMKTVKVFSLTTSLAGLAAQPILMEQGMKIGGTGMAVFICSLAGFFTFVTPLLLHFITKKYVTEIHYNPVTQEYTATTISIILQKIKTKFRPSDVKIPEVPGMFTSFDVGNRSLFVDPSLFEDPEHYVRIMGYDKPIDFKLDLKGTDTIVKDTDKSNK